MVATNGIGAALAEGYDQGVANPPWVQKWRRWLICKQRHRLLSGWHTMCIVPDGGGSMIDPRPHNQRNTPS